jgi:hypothetical protein
MFGTKYWHKASLSLGVFLFLIGASLAYAQEMTTGVEATPAQQTLSPAEMPVPGGQFRHPYAPLGVPGAHVLKPGKWMVSYTYGHMAMDGNLDGTEEVSTQQILKKYPIAPESMDVDMHMIGVMRGITDDFSVMLMLPYYFKSMTMVTRKGVSFTCQSEGIGDLQLAGLYSLYRSSMHQVVFSGGLSVPTGSIDARDDTPMALNSKLGYTMQLGSGTVDLVPALTYMGKWDRVHWGAQASGIVRLDENYNDYRWGDQYRLTGWGGYQLYPGVIASLRLAWQSWDDIHGADPEFDPKSTPGKDPNLRGGSRLDILPGLAWYIDEGPLKGNRLFIEGGVPVYQYLDGPQGKMTWMLAAGWKWVF